MKVSILSTAHVHFEAFASAVKQCTGTELAGIYDDDAHRGKKKAADLQTVFFENIHDALAVCEAVVVCSENAKHEELVLAAIEANKHVLCEKPLAISTVSAERMAKKAVEQDVVLATAFPLRFNTPAMEMKRVIEQKQIGEVLAFHGVNPGQCPKGWFIDKKLSGGGALMDHIVHLADLMRWLTGAEVSKVYAEADSFLVPCITIDDVGHVQLEFNNGIIADIDPSWSRPEGFPTWGGIDLRATGTQGAVDLRAYAQKVTQYNNTKTLHHDYGDFEYLYMMNAFVETIENQQTELANAWDGVAATKIVDAAYQSAKEHEVVTIA
ncbi:Gfo/Idh/MocA family protein [Fictibacillus enclensis]|uniref:Gfo/Idh/MocA family protein n=1 Tax=Fictibacillus enclensis TaxID=1017270 RepID=UPI0024C073F8|nr:Gfo/Idh/MocA family oxidoreductase [Fictibacillus enclensis]WHY71799.1 Gfo/Idh/MocA family oxidoreductase [Fictibacillus enclensis]